MDKSKIILETINSFETNSKKAQVAIHDAKNKTVNNSKHDKSLEQSDFSKKDILKMIEKMKKIAGGSEKIQFSFHEKTNRIIIKFLSEDNEIIREIPSKDSIKLLEHLQQQMGLLFDESR